MNDQDFRRVYPDFASFRKPFDRQADIKIRRVLQFVLLFLFILMLLPWTQNIKGDGKITTLRPEQRPQDVQAVIAGKIENWFVKEGDLVRRGDTLLELSEVKENYLDPELLKRTEEQIIAKEGSIDNYRLKIAAIEAQKDALLQARDFKMNQYRTKRQQINLNIITDSAALEAVRVELRIAREQFQRQQELYQKGLKSLTELEQRKMAFQNMEAKATQVENKLRNTRNDEVNLLLEMQGYDREVTEKINKLSSDIYSALSDVNVGEGDVAKLKNMFSGYARRQSFYFVTAPQDGQVTKTIRAGIGEVVKEGTILFKVVPQQYDIATEVYVAPFDMPIVHLNQKVRLQFDGWPAIVFSGWPGTSFGTYGGKVAAIENDISENGRYRVLIAPDPDERPWPEALKIGGGAKSMLLLKDVPVGYELWRQMNGFPPDFYTPEPVAKKEKGKE